LTYANVTATLALVLALGTGAVYAAEQIGSGEIANNSVRTQDLKDRKAVEGEDVKKNSLGSAEIDESSLITLQGEQAADCDPLNAVYVDCVAETLDLDSPSQLLVTATGGFSSEANDAKADCEIRIDGEDEPLSESPGEVADNTSALATDGFARTLVSSPLTSGPHMVALACQQLGAADARIRTPTIAIIAISTG
jgi:hypothetical protein